MTQRPSDILALHQDNLQRAVDFLKFAEAKNGAAIAFASALMLATLQIREKISDLQLNEVIGLVIALVAGLVSARSFLPQLSWLSTKKTGLDCGPNLLFFADIAKLSAEEFQEQFASRYSESGSDLEHDLSVQTVANSRIAADKMNHFSIAAFLLVLSSLLLTSSFVVELFSRF